MSTSAFPQRHPKDLAAQYALGTVYAKCNEILGLLLVLPANLLSFSDVLIIIAV